MKTVIALLGLTACCLAAEAPFYQAKSQGALLLLPLQQSTNATNVSTTARPAGDSSENLEYVNSRATERLKQEEGSEQDVYHVYLQDGRLQRVQYVTAPVRSGQQAQQQQAASNNYNQEQQTPEILTPGYADRRGVYFVQVPQERIQALQANYKEAAQQNGQYTQGSSAADEVVVRYLPIQLSEDGNQYSRQQVEQPYSYQANIQYSQVEPIQGPVYSYQPQSLTRILRYAPVY